MDEHFQTGSVVGKKSDTHWAQVVKTPYAFGVIEVEDDEGHAQAQGMELLHHINKEVSEPGLSVQQMFSTIDSLWKSYKGTLILCIPVGDVVTILLRGTGVVYLKRDGNICRLRSEEGTVSGKIRPSDIFFLSSKTCLNGISEEEFFSFFDHMSVTESAEKLTLYLHKKNDLMGYAGLFIGVNGGVEESKNAPVQEHPVLSSFSNRRRSLRLGGVKRKIMLSIQKLRSMDIRIASILIALFLISVVVGIVRERSVRRATEATKTISEVQRLYDEGVALMDLNIVKSRERLGEAKQLIEEVKNTVSPRTKEGRMISDLEKKINEELPKATKEYEVTPELFFDVSLLKSGSTISTFGMYEDTMTLLDTNAETVFYLQLSTKNGQIAGGGTNFDGSQKVAIHGERIYVLTTDGINAVSVGDKSVKPLVVKKAEDWISIKAMSAFAGNLYLLDTGKSRIWKYVATASAFSDMREYLNPDFFPDLSKATTLAIDGSVWLGTTNGSIMRFTQGKEDAFIPKGVEPELGITTMVYTDDVCEDVYVLDPDHTRVVVLEKDGMYKAQYKYPSTFVPSEIAASEKLGKLFFFSEGKLYTTPLQL